MWPNSKSVLYHFGKYGYHQEEKSFAFKLRVVEYAEQDTNIGAGRKFQEL